MAIDRLNRPESLYELALRELRSAVVEGRLKLADQVSEQGLSQMLGISKTPVREALQELRREGLVKINPQRGTFIFCLEDDEIEQIGDFRILLELAAARAIFKASPSAAAGRIRKNVAAMHEALSNSDVRTYRRLDADFHAVLIECCGNPYIAQAYSLISAKIGALRTRAHDDQNVIDRSLHMHTHLCELMESGDEKRFCERLEFHIRNAGRDYRSWLQRHETASDETAHAEEA